MKTKTTDDLDELFVVVDKNDKIIGYKTRKECHSNRSLIHRSIAVVIYNDKDEILMHKRSKSKDLYGGFYAVGTGGHVNKGETYLHAAHREIQEELSFDTKLEYTAKKIIDTGIEQEMMVMYKGKYNGPFSPDTIEVELVKFYSFDEIRNNATKGVMKLSPTSKIILKELNIL